jgi:hypothetical protein
VNFEYEHQFLNENRDLSLRLAGAPANSGNFLLNIGRTDHDYYDLGGSLAFSWPGGMSAFLHYETRLGQAKLSSDIAELGFRLPF